MADAIEIRQAKQKEIMVEQLKVAPIVQIACSKCGVPRSTYYRWAKEDPEFAILVEAAIEEGTNIINDLAESQLVTLIKDGNISGIFYWLNHRHPRFVNKLELLTKNDKPIGLTDEQIAKINSVVSSFEKLEESETENTAEAAEEETANE